MASNIPNHTAFCKRCNELVDLERTHGRKFCDGCVDNMITEFPTIQRENDILRLIAAKIMPCHYCKVDEIAKCPHGFPGCALADDTIFGEKAVSKSIRDLREKLRLSDAHCEKQRRFLGNLFVGNYPVSAIQAFLDGTLDE